MKKIQYFLLTLMFVFTLSFLSACGNEDEIPVDGVEFTQGFYTMIQGDSLQLSVNIKPIEATNKAVTYSVLEGKGFLSVDSNGLVTAGIIEGNQPKTGQIQVRTDYGKHSAVCYVKVIPEKIKLGIPTGLKFDKQTSSIVWDLVTFEDTDTSQAQMPDYNPCYTLSIKKDNGAEQIIQSERVRNYKVTESGYYVVKVKSQSDNVAFKDSDFSAEYKFSILKTPDAPTIADGNIVLNKVRTSFDAGLDNYELVVTNIATNTQVSTSGFTATETENLVRWQIPSSSANILQAGKYEYKVRLLGDGKGTNDTRYFSSGFSDTTNTIFIQLGNPAPESILVSNNILTWGVVNYAVSYSVYVSEEGQSTPTYIYDNILTNSWNLTNEVLALESYSITVKAIGNGSNILSGLSSKIANQKLISPQNLKIEDGVISWNSVKGAYSYSVFLNDSLTAVSNSTSTSYAIESNDIFNVGENTIKVVALPPQDNKTLLASDASILNVTKLGTPTFATSKGNISWSGVQDAYQYKISITPEKMTEKEYLVSAETFTFEMDSDFVDGNYEVTIQAMGDERSVLHGPVSNKVAFVKQSAPVDLSITENGALSWAKGTYSFNSSTYQVVIKDATGVLEDQIISVSENYCDVSKYISTNGYGNCFFTVKAVNNLTSQKYLNSEMSESVTTYKLDTPTGLRILNGQLSWTPISDNISDVSIKNLFKYRVKIDNDTTQTTSFTTITPRKETCYAGSHRAWAQAYVSGDNKIEINGKPAFLLSSNFTDAFEFVKLDTPSSPKIADNVVSGTMISGISNYTLIVTTPSGGEKYIQSDKLSLSGNQWSIFVDNLMDTSQSAGTYKISVQADGNNLYINSDKSNVLYIYRLQSPTLKVVNGVLEWNVVFSEMYGNIAPIKSYKIEFRKKSSQTWEQFLPKEGNYSWDMYSQEAGVYQVYITAQGPSNVILSSAPSGILEVEKLGSVDTGSIAVNPASELYDAITWNKVTYLKDDVSTEANYNVCVYQDYKTVKVLKESTDVKINNFKFSESYTANNYWITLQAIADGKISGDITKEFKINRLNQVTGINIDSNGDVTWDEVANADDYVMYVGARKIDDNVITKDNRVAQLLTKILRSNEKGALGITIVGVVDGRTPQSNGELTISGAPSVQYNVFRYVEPKLSITGGEIVWTNSNFTNFGYELTFIHKNGGTHTETLAKNTSSFAMSDTTIFATGADDLYSVTIKALGNGGIYLPSEVSAFEVNGSTAYVKKLAEPTFEVENGILKWTDDVNASSYTLITKSGEKTVILDGITSDATNVGNFVAMPISAVKGMSGKIDFTIQAVGSPSADSQTVYINSTVNTTYAVKKHAVPTNLGVIDGEIEWEREITRYENVGGTQYNVLSGYNVIYGESNLDVGAKDLNEKFILSKYITEKANLNVQVCALGNSGNFEDAFGSVYLNSDYCNSMSVVINGRPENLGIKNGVITWTENAQDLSTYNDYELIVKQGASTHYITSAKNQSILSELSGTFDQITVRHYGTKNSSSPYGIKYVNSAQTEIPLSNVVKLGVPITKVSADGEFVWNASDFEIGAFKAGITFSVNGTSDETTGNNSQESSFILNGDYSSNIIGSSETLNITGYAQGSTSKDDVFDGKVYINSENFALNAYRFIPVTMFDIDDKGLKFVWEASSSSANGLIKNDRFIIEYKLGDNAKNSEAEWQTKIVGDLREFPLWELTKYEARISVFSSKSNVIKSQYVACAATENSAFTFNKFESGQGTPEDPFVISDTTQKDVVLGTTIKVDKTTAETKFNYINTIPSAFFKLAEDIDLDTLSSEQYFKNFNGAIGGAYQSFTGGIDGQGFSIKNYQVYKQAYYTALFETIEGDKRAGFTGSVKDDTFFGRYGVIKNLNLEISQFDTDFTNTSFVAFFTNTLYGGWIVDCNLSLQSGKFENDAIEIKGIESMGNVTYGGFVGIMRSTKSINVEGSIKDANLTNEQKESLKFKDARVMNCSSSINISFTTGQVSINSLTLMGGIVGFNYGGTIYNCKNLGDLGGTQVAGMSVLADKVESFMLQENAWIYAGENWALISGCENKGTLTSYPISDTKTSKSNSGGIVGTLECGNIVFCLNNGEMIAKNGNFNVGADLRPVAVTMGGIVGEFKNGSIVNCVNIKNVYAGDQQSFGDIDELNSAMGALVGTSAAGQDAILNSFYDKTVCSIPYDGEVTEFTGGLETSELQDESFIHRLLPDPTSDNLPYYYDKDLGKKPTFVYNLNNYPTISWQ